MVRKADASTKEEGRRWRKVNPQLYSALEGIRGEIRLSEPLSALTSLRIGGPADSVVIPEDIDDLCRLVRQAQAAKVPILVIGGTNVLVRDQGVRGIVVQLNRLTAIRDEPHDMVFAQAGVRMPVLLQHAISRSLSGLEWAAGIPGTVGGGVMMNAGTALGEMKDVLKAIEVVGSRGTLLTRQASDLSFGYRRARVPKGVIVGAWFQLRPATKKKVECSTKTYLQYRKKHSTVGSPQCRFNL